MSNLDPVPLTPFPIGLRDAAFGEIGDWPYADAFVARLLRHDVPQRMRRNGCRLFGYRDPDDQLVGFGTLEESDEYARLLNGLKHAYLPLLAVNPTIKSRGYGSTILGHLLDTAAELKQSRGWSSRGCDLLLLDVYASSERALALYQRFGFQKLGDEPERDPAEADAPYFIMFKPI
ncbi:MAG TPA: GNAT family N-acetyltransferase [Pirellulales bacterium]